MDGSPAASGSSACREADGGAGGELIVAATAPAGSTGSGEGGSIPIVGEFERILDAPALLVGFALPGCNMHAPNEWFTIENYEKGIGSLCRLYAELGARLG